MEGQFQIGGSSRSTTQDGLRAIPTIEPERPVRPWQFVGEFQQLMGDSAEPDPMFFVESWTLGTAAATENLRRRRLAGAPQQQSARPETDWVNPLAFVENSANTQLHSVGQAFAATASYGLPLQSAPQTHEETGSDTPEQEWQTLAEEYERNGERIEPMTADRACRVLGVSTASNGAQIKAAYHRKVNQWHPDRLQRRTERERGLATRQMADINEAYHLLRKSA